MSEPAGPLISFIICGRNDNYMGNYNWRITTAMNCLVRNLVRIGRQNDAEIILADWNSPVPFHREMLLVPEAKGLLRFLVIPPDIAIPAQKDSVFPNPLAQNAAVRRSRSRFTSVSDADVIFPASSLLVLFAILEGKLAIGSPVEKTFLIASRAQIPTTRTRHNPPLAEIEAFIDRNAAVLKRDRLFEGLGAPAGMVLMARELWFESRGYDERLIHHGWGDIELHLRLSQHYPWLDLANFGAGTLHLEHYAGDRNTSTAPRQYNGFNVNRRMAVNDENWGLGAVNLSFHDPEAVRDEAVEARIAAAAAQDRAAPITIEALARELQQPEIGQILEGVQRAIPHNPAEHERLLAWYSRFRHPRTYVELGVALSSSHLVVLAGCPTCEAYLIDQWSEDDAGGERPIYHAANIAGAAVPQAQAHFITGEMATALPRLFTAIRPELQLDLALLRTHPRFGNPLQNALLAAEHLAPGGAIILSATTADEFAPVWAALAPKFSNNLQMQIQSPTGQIHAGMFLAVTPN